MKKTIALLLILCLLLSASAFAYFQFFSAPKAPEPFTLRNGYYWGMPKEEALALAAEEGLTEISDSNPMLYIRSVPVDENYTSTFSLSFHDEGSLLNGMRYTIENVTEGEYLHMLEYFTHAIETKYNVSREDWTGNSSLPLYVFPLPDTNIAIMRSDPLDKSSEPTRKFSFYIIYEPIGRSKKPTSTTPPANYGI